MPTLHRLAATGYIFLVLILTGCSAGEVEAPLRPLIDPSWQVQYTDTTALFIGASVVDEHTVWVSGTRGRYVKTTDGGATWTPGVVPGAENLQFRDVHGFDGDNAFLLSIGNGPDSRIYRTRDGGATWDLSFQARDSTAFFDCLSFWDEERGFAFSDSHEGEFRLIRTLDGGASWERIPPEAVPDARDGEGAFASSGTCVITRPGGLGWFSTGASGVDTRVFSTTDYGDTWSAVVTPIESNSGGSGIFSLSFLDDEQGAAFGGDYGRPDSVFNNVAVTMDGGASWALAGRSGLGGSIFGGTYVPEAPTATMVAVAPTGSEFSTDNGMTWTRIDSVSYWSVVFAHADAGWAVGPNVIAKIVNGSAE